MKGRLAHRFVIVVALASGLTGCAAQADSPADFRQRAERVGVHCQDFTQELLGSEDGAAALACTTDGTSTDFRIGDENVSDIVFFERRPAFFTQLLRSLAEPTIVFGGPQDSPALLGRKFVVLGARRNLETLRQQVGGEIYPRPQLLPHWDPTP